MMSLKMLINDAHSILCKNGSLCYHASRDRQRCNPAVGAKMVDRGCHGATTDHPISTTVHCHTPNPLSGALWGGGGG